MSSSRPLTTLSTEFDLPGGRRISRRYSFSPGYNFSSTARCSLRRTRGPTPPGKVNWPARPGDVRGNSKDRIGVYLPTLANAQAICNPPAAKYSPRIHFILDHSRLSTPYEFGAPPRPGIVIDDITYGKAAHRLHATRGVTAWELLAMPPRCLPLRRRGRGRRHRCRHRRRLRRPRSAGSRRRCGSSGRSGLNSRGDRAL